MWFHLGFSGLVNSRVLFWKSVWVCVCVRVFVYVCLEEWCFVGDERLSDCGDGGEHIERGWELRLLRAKSSDWQGCDAVEIHRHPVSSRSEADMNVLLIRLFDGIWLFINVRKQKYKLMSGVFYTMSPLTLLLFLSLLSARPAPAAWNHNTPPLTCLPGKTPQC